MKQRKKPFSKKSIAAAKLRAEGSTYEEIAKAVGYTDKSTARQAVITVVRFEQFEDQKQIRLDMELRLRAVQKRLYKLAGIRDPQDPDAQQPPVKPAAVLAGERTMTREERLSYMQECMNAGLDADGDPQTASEPAQQVGAARALIALEKRRASMFGSDMLKFGTPIDGKQIDPKDYESLAAELTKYGLPIPPLMAEELARRSNTQPRGETGAGSRLLTGGTERPA